MKILQKTNEDYLLTLKIPKREENGLREVTKTYSCVKCNACRASLQLLSLTFPKNRSAMRTCVAY